ncbi:uncharacterized protein LOC135184671 [Pogoniulus pusillus]|uniref:uncharacterized protein LOC135184671 n=1 Tax=Pogoniulus pusillus TaxID=488313 RepID=UPI0030B982F0
MGNTAPGIEKASVEALLKFGQKAGDPLDRALVTDLLSWARRRGLLKETAQVFKDETWKHIGEEIWESVQTDNKEAKRLASTYRQISLLVQKIGAEAEVEAIIQTILKDAKNKVTSGSGAETKTAAETKTEIKTETKTVCPATQGPYDYLIPDWDPDKGAGGSQVPEPMEVGQAVPSAPQIDPATVPLPPEEEELKTLLHEQADAMTKLLNEMQRLDKGSKSRVVKESYRKAHKSIVEGLKNIEKQLTKIESGNCVHPAAVTEEKNTDGKMSVERVRQRVLQSIRDGEMDIEEGDWYLRSKYGSEARLSAEDKRKLADWFALYPQYKRKEDSASGMVDDVWKWWRGKANEEKSKETPKQRNSDYIPKDPNFDMSNRWKGVVTNAEITGDFQFTAAPVTIDNNGQRNWQPIDWTTVAKIQKAILDYGIDNRLVRRQMETFIKHQTLIPTDIKHLFELMLGPTSYMMFVNKWQERLEQKQLDNLTLPHGDPLRVASLEQLMGNGQYVDPQRQAALDLRILAQSKVAALEAFASLPQVGTPKQPYLQIKQKDNESFMAFVDRITEGVEMAPDIPANMKETLVKEIAMQNANAACRRLIATLPPAASLLQMVEQCSRAPMEEEKEKARIHASALAAALSKCSPQGKGDKGSNPVCFKCGQTGHFKKHCPTIKAVTNQVSSMSSPFAGTCNKCDKFGHRASDCKSRFKKDGTPLVPQQGNGGGRVGGAAQTSS